MRREDEVETESLMQLAAVVLDDLAKHPSLRVPNDQARSELGWETEQVELGTQPAMITLLCFFQLGQVRVELLRRRPGGPIDPLQLISLLVTPPVRPGAAKQLHGGDPSGGREVRPTAQVDEVDIPVDGDVLPGGDLTRLHTLDDLRLERVCA